MDPASCAQPAPLSWLSYFGAGSFCSCPGISRAAPERHQRPRSGAARGEGFSSGALRKDWITQFKGRRSLFSGGRSKSPELLPTLRLADPGLPPPLVPMDTGFAEPSQRQWPFVPGICGLNSGLAGLSSLAGCGGFVSLHFTPADGWGQLLAAGGTSRCGEGRQVPLDLPLLVLASL